MRILITGATGLAGQGVLRECLRASDVERVVALGRHATGVQRALDASFPWIDQETLDGLLARCDAVKSLDDLPPVTLPA